jgi:hypothetical protein
MTLLGRSSADIDGVLVGPATVQALEITSYGVEYRNYRERWEYKAGNQWRRLDNSASPQTRDGGLRLANFFRACWS